MTRRAYIHIDFTDAARRAADETNSANQNESCFADDFVLSISTTQHAELLKKVQGHSSRARISPDYKAEDERGGRLEAGCVAGAPDISFLQTANPLDHKALHLALDEIERGKAGLVIKVIMDEPLSTRGEALKFFSHDLINEHFGRVTA